MLKKPLGAPLRTGRVKGQDDVVRGAELRISSREKKNTCYQTSLAESFSLWKLMQQRL